MTNQSIILDGVKWHIGGRLMHQIQPICPKHHLRLRPQNEYESSYLYCDECEAPYKLPRIIARERQYVQNKIDAKVFKEMKFINLDDEAIPIAETKIKTKDNKYFTTALLTKSKVGLRLVIYAGEKNQSGKTQIFVEPEIKRLAFDQKDLHPSDVFIKLEATFKDGTTYRIKNAK